MAILPAVPSLAVELLQNCTAMMELNASAEDVANSSNNSIIKYVMAESGENFEIHWCIDRSNDSLFCGDTPTFTDHDLFTRVHIDGVYIDGLIWSKEELQLSEKFHDRLLRASSLNEDGQRVENRFSFSDIARTEEDLAVLSESVKEKLNSLGVIKVELWRIQGIQGVQDGVAVRSSTAEEVTSVPQRAVKTSSASHTVKFGEQIPVGQVHSCIFDWIHSENEPLATFIFRYRSLRALKSIGIVPRTPSPEPLEERDAESLTVDEARELIRRYKEQAAARREMKRERDEDADADDETASLVGHDDADVVFTNEKSRKRVRMSVDETMRREVIVLDD